MEQKITTVSLAVKDDKYYADKALYQWNYGQILRITGADLPMAVEVGFSTTEKSGDSDVRVGAADNGVTTVAIPDKLFKEERSTDYSIYAFVYVTDEDSGATVHEIVIPVKARAKPTDPSEDPAIDPSIFKDAINSVNASAERAEAAEKSAKESADKAKEYAESAGKSKEDVEKARDSAISAIDIEKESALRGIESKTVESLQKIQRQTEESQNSIKQSISDATEKNTELDGAISNATDAKGNLDKAVQSAGNAKTELDTSVGKAGEAKTALDSAISSAEEKQLALDTTVEQANTVDASLKEHIGSAEQIQANVEQIAKNKADISSLNEDLEEVKDKKITKFYASNQGETHLADSDNGKIMDMMLYGRSEQFSTTGAQLFNENIEIESRGVTIKINGSTVTFDGTVSDEDNFRVHYQKNIKLKPGKYTASSLNEKIFADFSVKKANDEMIYNNHIEIDGTEKEVKIRVLFGLRPSAKGDVINETTNIMLNDGDKALPYEPYTGGKPSPSPEYPQEIKSVVNPTVKVCGKNLWDNFKTLSLGNVEQKNGTYIATADTMQVDITAESVGARPLLLKANNAYTFSLKTTVSISSPKFVCLRYTNGERNNIVFINKNFVNFVPERDVEKVGFILYESVAGDKVYDVQLEMGSEATPYEPYQEEQTVTLPYTLNAIPVSSGGNYTDQSGQQWIADYVDVERGKVVRKIGKLILTGEENWMLGFENWTTYPHAFRAEELKKDILKGNTMNAKYMWYQKQANLDLNSMNAPYNRCIAVSDARFSSVNEFTNELKKQDSNGTPLTVYYVTDTPQEENLSLEEIEFLKSLSTYYPVTNISVNSEQLDGYTVFNYPISMANGWNYVKQQLNDNRDYIYDMDIQSAEAYVNSEYAVVLTELEV